VEFDVSISKARMEILIEKLKVIAPLDHARLIVEEHLEKEQGIQQGISYFNDERFWEAHEVLEGVWKKSYEGEKELVQGIILIAAALVHYQKAENSICLSILERAKDKLSRSSGTYHDVDVDKIRQKLDSITDSGKISLFTI
jgi:predicted metal-dependent hydrolase